MVSQNNRQANFFRLFAEVVRNIVIDRGGAIAMTRDELCEMVRQHDSRFDESCPQAVLSHPTMPLRRWAQLEVTGWEQMVSNGKLLIYLDTMNEKDAREHCEPKKLSPAEPVLAGAV